MSRRDLTTEEWIQMSSQLTAEEWIEVGLKLGFAPDKLKQALLSTTQESSEKQVSGDPRMEAIFADWNDFYFSLFRLRIDFSKLHIPAERQGFSRLLVIVEGLTPRHIFPRYSELFGNHSYGRNEKDGKLVLTSDRDPAKIGTYAIWVKDSPEPDENLKRVSANELSEAGVKGITLLERLLYELKYFTETNKHLDTRYRTLCSGSRFHDGTVPHVWWRTWEFTFADTHEEGVTSFVSIDDCSPRNQDWNTRARRVIA